MLNKVPLLMFQIIQSKILIYIKEDRAKIHNNAPLQQYILSPKCDKNSYLNKFKHLVI